MRDAALGSLSPSCLNQSLEHCWAPITLGSCIGMVIACAGRVQADIFVFINRYLLIGCESEYINEYADPDISSSPFPSSLRPAKLLKSTDTIKCSSSAKISTKSIRRTDKCTAFYPSTDSPKAKPQLNVDRGGIASGTQSRGYIPLEFSKNIGELTEQSLTVNTS